MDTKIAEEIIKRLDVVGSKLEIGSIKLGAEAVKYTFVNAIGSLVLAILFSISLPFIFTVVLNKYLKYKEGGEDYSEKPFFFGMAFVVTSIVLSLFWVFTIFYIPTLMAIMAAPAWEVTKTIIGK